jgi:IclR family transcriptional regulator, acetate operon repressor
LIHQINWVSHRKVSFFVKVASQGGNNTMSETESGSATLRAFNILEKVAHSETPMSLTDIVHSVELPKPTVYRILTTLEEAGVLIREPDGKHYVPGERLMRLCGDILMRSPQRSARHAIIEELVEQIGETCNLTIPNGNYVLYLDRVETHWPLKVNLHAGSKVPLYASASGKLFLAFMQKRARDRFLQNTPLIKHTKNTLADYKSLENEFKRIREVGYSVDNEEYLAGICCIAVPVTDEEGRVLAAVATHAPAARMNLTQALEHLPALKNAAESIATSIDWS